MSYAVKGDGTVWAWGLNDNGELGDGTTTTRLTPVRVQGLTEVVGVAGGRDHGLALRADGSVWAWGWNLYGQLGDGTTVDRLTPVPVTTGVREVIAGAHHSYALRSDGQVYSWGRNYRAELGDGTTTQRTRPVLVHNLANAVSIGSGRDHGVAVLADGTVRTWGHNASGQLGDGTTTNRTSAFVVPGVTNATAVGGGGSEYSTVLVSSGAQPPNQPPTATFSSSCLGLACSFDGSASRDTDGTVTSYAWDFGDGTVADGALPPHTYPRGGDYPVTLTVTDDDGATAVAQSTVTVAPASGSAVSFRASAATDANTTRPSVVVPSTVLAGDRLLLVLTTNRAATTTTPAGWTLLSTVSDGTDVRSWVFTRAAVAGTAGSTVQPTLDAISKCSLTLVGYAGAAAPSSVVGANEAGSTAAHGTPAAPVTTGGSTVVSYWADKVAAAHTWSLPPTVTARAATVGSGGGLLTSATGDTQTVSAGSWPGATADAGTSSAKAVSWTVVLPPA